MTTRGRKPKSTSPSAIAKREKYAADKAAKQATQTPMTDENVNHVGAILQEEAALEVEITPNEAPKPSLKERLFGGTNTPLPGSPTKAKTVKRGQRGKQIDASLLAKTFPTMVATMTASYAQRLIKDPYKACAPTQQEVYGTIGPLFSILSRRIEIVGTASEDIIDLISAVLAGSVAGIRIHITYLTIQEAVQKAKQNGHVANRVNGHTTNHSAGPISTRGTDSGAQFDTSQADSLPTGFTSGPSTSDSNGYADIADGHNGDAKPEAALFAELVKRDRTGRVRLGLLSE